MSIVFYKIFQERDLALWAGNSSLSLILGNLCSTFAFFFFHVFYSFLWKHQQCTYAIFCICYCCIILSLILECVFIVFVCLFVSNLICIRVIFIFYLVLFFWSLPASFHWFYSFIQFFFLEKRSFLLLLWGYREVFALTFSVSLWCIFFISPGFSTSLFSSSVPLTKFFVLFSYDDSLHGASCLLSMVWRGGAVVTGREEWPRGPPSFFGVCCLDHSSAVCYPPSESHPSQQGHERVRGTHCTASLELCVVSRCLHFHPPPSISFTSPLKSALTCSNSGEKYVGSDFQVFNFIVFSSLEIRTVSPWGKCSKVSFLYGLFFCCDLCGVYNLCKKHEKNQWSSKTENGREGNIFSLWKNSDHHVFLLGVYSGRVALNL